MGQFWAVFNSHEHLDALGLIHMNGRVYDPYLGRFTSADPFIQFPHNSQSYNRYSYVLNNPLSYTDPSGHFVFTLGAIAVTAFKTLSVYEAAALFAAAGFSDTLVAGGSFDQALKNGIISGVSAGAFTKLGAVTGFSSVEAGMVRVGSFGAVGGITSVMAGGKFGHGFVSAGLGAASQAVPGTGQGAPGGHIKRTVVASIVGGTSSRISGGKFANGAATAAFSSIISEGVNAARPPRLGGEVSVDTGQINTPADKSFAIESLRTLVGDPDVNQASLYSAGLDALAVNIGVTLTPTEARVAAAIQNTRSHQLTVVQGLGVATAGPLICSAAPGACINAAGGVGAGLVEDLILGNQITPAGVTYDAAWGATVGRATGAMGGDMGTVRWGIWKFNDEVLSRSVELAF